MAASRVHSGKERGKKRRDKERKAESIPKGGAGGGGGNGERVQGKGRDVGGERRPTIHPSIRLPNSPVPVCAWKSSDVDPVSHSVREANGRLGRRR